MQAKALTWCEAHQPRRWNYFPQRIVVLLLASITRQKNINVVSTILYLASWQSIIALGLGISSSSSYLVRVLRTHPEYQLINMNVLCCKSNWEITHCSTAYGVWYESLVTYCSNSLECQKCMLRTATSTYCTVCLTQNRGHKDGDPGPLSILCRAHGHFSVWDRGMTA